MHKVLQVVGWLASLFLGFLAIGGGAANLEDGGDPAVGFGLALLALAIVVNPLYRVRPMTRVAAVSALLVAAVLAVALHDVHMAVGTAFGAFALWAVWQVARKERAPASAGVEAPTAAPSAARTAPAAAPGPLSDAQFYRLAGLCEGILANQRLEVAEAQRLRELLRSDPGYETDPRTRNLREEVEQALADERLSEDEAEDLFVALTEFCEASEPEGANEGGHAAPAAHPLPAALAAPRPGDHYEIVYEDARGKVSRREIELRKVSRKGDHTYISAICQSRRSFRMFRADRVQEALNTDTGELFENPLEHFAMETA